MHVHFNIHNNVYLVKVYCCSLPAPGIKSESVYWYGMDIPYEVQRYLRWPEP